MIASKTKELFKKLDMEYPAIAIKYHAVKPQDVAPYQGENAAFCMYVKYAQDNEKTFYITKALVRRLMPAALSFLDRCAQFACVIFFRRQPMAQMA